MQRPEQDGDTGGLELLQLNGNGVDVVDEESVVCVGGVLERGGDVEVRRGGVETRVPRLSGSVVETGWGSPMPYESDDATLGGECNCLVDVGAGSAARDAGFRVVHQVDAEDGWRLPNIGGDPVKGSLVLLAGEDVLSVNAAEIREEGFGI